MKNLQSLRAFAAIILCCGAASAAENEPAALPVPNRPTAVPVVAAPAPLEATQGMMPVAPAAPIEAVPTVCGPTQFNFSKVPSVRGPQLLGPRPIPPTGPGYYSLLDLIQGECRQAPPKYPYPRFGLMGPTAADMGFNYLDDPKNTEHDYADPLKRMKLGNDWMLSIGGQSWGRYMNEYNSRLGRVDNDYFLYRNRVSADLWYKDLFRVYVEGINSNTVGQTLPPLAIDGTGTDFLNLFVDIKLGEYAEKPIYGRVGRQELNFGSQRLVSSLDWANTRRTFQGASVFRNGDKWDATQ